MADTLTYVPDDLRVARCRDGFRLDLGVLPHHGERVLLSPMSGAQFRHEYWFLADSVEDAYQPGWAYLWGWYVANGAHVREYVHIAGLRVERLMEPAPHVGRHRTG